MLDRYQRVGRAFRAAPDRHVWKGRGLRAGHRPPLADVFRGYLDLRRDEREDLDHRAGPDCNMAAVSVSGADH